MWTRLAIVFGVLLSGTPVATQSSGNRAEGLVIARDLCATCHQVERDQTVITYKAANFREIANTPGMTSLALSVWFQTPHRKMPNLILTLKQRNDLVA